MRRRIGILVALACFNPVFTPSLADTCRNKILHNMEEFNDWYSGVTSTLGTDYTIGSYINDALFRNTVDGLVPGVIADISIDETTRIATLKIDTDCKWSDGTPITANDIKAGLEMIFDPAASEIIPVDGIIQNAKAVKLGELPLDALNIQTPDAQTVEFKTELGLDSLKVKFNDAFVIPVASELVLNDPDYLSRQEMPVKFSGPYFVESYEADSMTFHLIANPYFCGEKPEYPELKLEAIADLSEFFVSGAHQNDLLSIDAYGSDELLNAILSTDWIEDGFNAERTNMTHVNHYRLNAKNGPLKQKDLRKALTLAIDWEGSTGIYQRTSSGSVRLQPADTLVPPQYVENAPEFPKDTRAREARLEEARALLAQNDFNADNPLLLSAAILKSQGYLFYPMKEMIESELPITIAVSEFANETLYYDTVHIAEQTTFDLSIAAWGTDLPSSLFYLEYYVYNNNSADALANQAEPFLDRIRTSSDPEDVAEAEREAVALINEELNFVPISLSGEIWLVSKDAERRHVTEHPIPLDLKPKSNTLCSNETLTSENSG